MTEEEHRQRHIELHRAFDELAADFIGQHNCDKTLSNTTLMELLHWSFQQTVKPGSLEHPYRDFRLPDYCAWCGAYLQGGATVHKDGCEIKTMIEESFDGRKTP